ncbi:MAG: hypothetical protein R2828_33810 [Saprospiraceae bacterium]
MDYIGLLVELFFMGMGLYFLLLSFGKITIKDPAKKAKAAAFFEGNTLLLRIVAVVLVLVMGLNLFVHVRQLLL